MRAVTTATAAVVLGLERKTLDRMLLQLGPRALPPGRQGVERRIPIALLESLALTSALVDGTGMRIRDAFALAGDLTGSGRPAGAGNGAAALEPVAAASDSGAAATKAGPHTSIGPYLRLEADLPALKREIAQRLELAIENVVRRRRGRPRGRAATRKQSRLS